MSFFDYAIVIVYCMAIFLVSWKTGYHTKNLKDYAIGNRDFPTISLVSTIFATGFGAFALNGMLGISYQYGIRAFWFLDFPSVIKLWLLAYIATKHIHKFYGMISVGDIINSIYGKYPRLITGVIGVISGYCAVALQIVGMSTIFEYFLNMPHVLATIVSGSVVVAYTCVGGIRGVVWTDVFQLSLIAISVPMFFSIAVSMCGGYQAFYASIPFSHKVVDFSDPENAQWICMGIVNLFPVLIPLFLQRMLMTSSRAQVKRVTLTYVFIYAMACIFVVLLGMVFFVFEQKFKTGIAPELMLNYFIDNYVPVFFKGIAVVGIISVIMSTIDSLLNTISVLLVNDLVIPVFKNLNEKMALTLTKVSAIFLGVASIMISLLENNLYILNVVTLNIIDATFAAPLLFGFIGFKTSPGSFYAACISGIGMSLYSRVFGIPYVTSLLWTLTANIVGFLIWHYFLLMFTDRFEGKSVGFIRSEHDREDFKGLLSSVKKWRTIAYLRQVFTDIKLFNVFRFCRADVLQFGAEDQLFPIFIMITMIFPLFMSESSVVSTKITYLIRYTMVLISFCMLLRQKMPMWYQRNWEFYWHACLIFCLPFSGFVLLILNGGTFYWHMSMILCIFLLGLLTSLRMFLIDAIIGFGLAIVILWDRLPMNILSNVVQTYVLIYGYLFTVVIVLIFGRRKQLRDAERMESYIKSAGVVSHELSSPIGILGCSLERMEKVIRKKDLSDKNREELVETIDVSRRMLISMESFMTLFLQNVKNIDDLSSFELEEIDLYSLVHDIISGYPLHNRQDEIIRIISDNNFYVLGNRVLITQAVLNILRNSLFFISGIKDATITVSFDIPTAGLFNFMSIKDTGMGMTEGVKDNLFKKFYTQRDGGYGLGLFFCTSAMRRMGGLIECGSVLGEYTEMIFKFPKILVPEVLE